MVFGTTIVNWGVVMIKINKSKISSIKWWLISKLPRSVIYMCNVRLIATVTFGKYSDTDLEKLTLKEALIRWYRYDHKDEG